MSDKLKVEICSDHFQRLVDGKTCATCPSRIENEDKCRALAALLEKDSETQLGTVVTEISAIRHSQKQLSEKIQKIDGKVNGNGTQGLAARLLVLETRLDVAQKNTGTYVAIATAAVGALLSIIGILMK